MSRLVYCHGFSSGPQSRKARALRAALGPEGWEMAAPDLNVPSFERLSWDAMVARAADAVAAAPTDVLVGSSLGALVALEASRRAPAPLVLIAPVLGFGPRWCLPLPAGDPVCFTDAATGVERRIHRAFVEAFLRGSDDLAAPARPVTVVAGHRDETIAIANVRATWDRWLASGALAPRSELICLAGADHGMAGFDDVIADAVRRRAR